MSNETEHQQCVDLTIAYFQVRGIACEDFELQVGHAAVRRPDLTLPEFHTLIEVKTFKRLEKEREEEQRLGQDFLAGKVSAYFYPTFYNRFDKDLRHARQKFREYPKHHTAVLFFDQHSMFHKQSPEDLLLGQEYYTFAFPNDASQNSGPLRYGRNKRQLRQDKNHEIGAVVFHTVGNAFQVFHNRFADTGRRIHPDIFALPEDEHFEYIDDSGDPKIIPFKQKEV